MLLIESKQLRIDKVCKEVPRVGKKTDTLTSDTTYCFNGQVPCQKKWVKKERHILPVFLSVQQRKDVVNALPLGRLILVTIGQLLSVCYPVAQRRRIGE